LQSNIPKRIYIFTGLVLLCWGIIGCAAPSVKPLQPKTIAVWDLSDYTAVEGSQAEMGEILSAKLIQTLQETGNITVVERQKIVLALDELNIGSSEIAEESTKLRIGKLLGATQMVFGGYQVFGDMMRLDIRLVQVETGKIIKAVEKTVPSVKISQWLNAAEDAGKELVE